MTPTTDTLPPEVALPVPRAFQDYVTRRQSKRYLLAIAGCVGLFALFSLGKSSAPYVDASVLFLLINAAVWFATRKKAWHYEVSAKSVTLFWLKPFWGETLRQDMEWKRGVILSIEQTEWRGLPALRVHAKLKSEKTPQDLWMVYAHEDADTVTNVVLPLIETYRQQYRHPLWADTLRQEKP